MSRYIDADALIADLEHDIAVDEDALNYVGTVGAERKNTQFDKDCKQNAIDLLMHAPSIDIVRCKGCQHWNEDGFKCSIIPSDEPWYANDYCSYGERKEGEVIADE